MVEFLKTLAIACIPAIITGIVTYIVARKNAASQIMNRISKQFLDLTLCNSANGGKACIYGLFRHLLYGRTIRI